MLAPNMMAEEEVAEEQEGAVKGGDGGTRASPCTRTAPVLKHVRVQYPSPPPPRALDGGEEGAKVHRSGAPVRVLVGGSDATPSHQGPEYGIGERRRGGDEDGE